MTAGANNSNQREPSAKGGAADVKSLSMHPDFQKLVSSGWRFRVWLFANIPSAFFSGLRVAHIDDSGATITVPYKRFTKNPFRSVYFACLSMAAEMSTGILAMGFIYKRQSVSMLVTGLEAKFFKKATGLIRFECRDGQQIKAVIDRAVETGEPQNVVSHSFGTNPSGEIIAEFSITWSFKRRNSSPKMPASSAG